MPNDFIKIEVQGIEKITAALAKFPRQIGVALRGAGKDAATNIIFPTEGLKKYPPLSAANRPPVPYYIRGRGTQTAHGNLGKSERLGTQFYAKASGSYATEIGNRASYARYVVGEDQNRYMPFLGWKRLRQVVEEKMTEITATYQKWVDKLIKDLGL